MERSTTPRRKALPTHRPTHPPTSPQTEPNQTKPNQTPTPQPTPCLCVSHILPHRAPFCLKCSMARPTMIGAQSTTYDDFDGGWEKAWHRRSKQRKSDARAAVGSQAWKGWQSWARWKASRNKKKNLCGRWEFE